MPPMWTMANIRILILGGFLLIVCMVLFSWKNGPFFGSDALGKLTEIPTVKEDGCFVATTVNNKTVLPAAGLHSVLKRAAMEDSTVIVTNTNLAWAQPDSLLDLFLKSFEDGKRNLLNHLVVVTLNEMAYERCKEVHPHCVLWEMEGINHAEENRFMTPGYLDIIWGKLCLLRTILELGYNYVFTDVDIMWLRDPLPLLRNISRTSAPDIIMACDHYGNPQGCSVNTGFYYAKANNKTKLFHRYWHGSRDRYSKEHEQHAFNKIKRDRFVRELGMNFHFLDTKAFSGFCEHGLDLGQVYTMHANCCGNGLENKLHDLKVVMEDWGNYTSNNAAASTTTSNITWRIPQHCRTF